MNKARRISKQLALEFADKFAVWVCSAHRVRQGPGRSPPEPVRKVGSSLWLLLLVALFSFTRNGHGAEAISREMSVFDFSISSTGPETVSREVSVFNFSISSTGPEAVSRELGKR